MTNRLKDERLEQMERGKDKMCRQKARKGTKGWIKIQISNQIKYIYLSQVKNIENIIF